MPPFTGAGGRGTWAGLILFRSAGTGSGRASPSRSRHWRRFSSSLGPETREPSARNRSRGSGVLWLLTESMAAIKPPKPRRAFSWVAGLVAFVLAVSVIATFEVIRAASTKHPHATTPIGTVLPTPTPQPITRKPA